jgi:hypothetical protein
MIFGSKNLKTQTLAQQKEKERETDNVGVWECLWFDFDVF